MTRKSVTVGAAHTSNLILTKIKRKSLCYLCDFVYSKLYK